MYQYVYGNTIEWQQSDSLLVSWDTAGALWASGNDAFDRYHALSQSHHLMKALLEAEMLYKHHLLYDTYYMCVCVYVYIYIYNVCVWVS